MSAELSGYPTNEQPLQTVGQRLDTLVKLAQYQVDHALPQNNDPYTTAYEIAFARALNENESFRETLAVYLDIRPDLKPHILLRQAHKTFQYLESSLDSHFPHNHSTPEAWEAAFSALLNDTDYASRFDGNILLPIMSNVSERGVLLKTIAMLHDKAASLRVLDLGCSLNDVLKRLALEKDTDLGYQPIDVMRREHRSGATPYLDERVTRHFNHWLDNSRVNLVQSVGMDAMPYDRDERLRDRAVSDSRYMGELVLERLSQQFDILAHVQPREVRFVNDDAASYNPKDLGQQFDVVYASTWMYQAPPEDVKSTLTRAEASVKDDGLIIVQDFVRTFRHNRTPHFYVRWPKWTYKVWVKDMQRPELGFQHYLTARSGRVEAIIPNERVLGRLLVARHVGLAEEA